MQACPGCGMTTEEAGRFCPGCGHLLDGSRESSGRDPAGSLIGCTVGDFAIEAVIGGGSFGTVYRGRQLGLDRPVAVKVPSYEIAADPVQARRFSREARAAARVVHPGVVAIYAIGELIDGRPYLAMQLIDGAPLDRIFADGVVPPLRALRIARAIASALSETHAAGVVHRDLKPSNIMWRRDRNGDDRITLVDFGIAVCRPGNADATRLTSGGLIGTPHYMSPEQAHGEHVDGRADLYALGCVMFELVTGATPFDGAGFEVVVAHLGRPAPLASERNPAVPPVFDRLIARLMEKKPDDRPTGADAVVAMIDDAIAELEGRDPATARGVREPACSAIALPRAAQALSRSYSPERLARARSPALSQSLEMSETSEAALVLPRRTGARWFAVAAIGALALSGAGFAALRLRSAASADEPEPSETAAGTLVSASGEAMRMIARDDGELIIRTMVPEVIRANVPIHAHLEIKTKLGGQFSAKQVVITIEDPQHNATAQTAMVRDDHPGHYAFRHRFAEPGRYIVRVFPSETETVSTIDLDVVP